MKKQVKLVLNVLLLSIFMMVHVHTHLIICTHKYVYLYISLPTNKNLTCIVFAASMGVRQKNTEEQSH